MDSKKNFITQSVTGTKWPICDMSNKTVIASTSIPDSNVEVEIEVSEYVLQVARRDLYELAKANGFSGTLNEFLDKFAEDSNGDSAFDIAVQNGFQGGQEEWLLSLKGADGIDGHNGLSAYDIAVKHGFRGSEQEFSSILGGYMEYASNNW